MKSKKKSKKNIVFKLLFVTAPLIFLLMVAWIRSTNFSGYRSLVAEDAFFETAQYFLYFLASAVLFLSVVLTYVKHKKVFLFELLLSAALFAISLEEISWGQRLLRFRNPSYFAYNNVQSEVTIHNLRSFQPYLHTAYIFVGLLLGLVPFLLTILNGASSQSRKRQLNAFRFGKYFPSTNLAWYFLPLSAVYAILIAFPPISLTGPNTYGFIWRDQEIGEMLLAAGLFLWSVMLSRKLWQSISKFS